jgi:hypothetical protein
MSIKTVAAVVAALFHQLFEPRSPTMLTGSSTDVLSPMLPPSGER